jgi:signal transduction histidine kinase
MGAGNSALTRPDPLGGYSNFAPRAIFAEHVRFATNRPSIQFSRIFFTDKDGRPHEFEPSANAPVLIPAGGRALEVHFTPQGVEGGNPGRFTTLLMRDGAEIALFESDRPEVSFDWLPPGTYGLQIQPLKYAGVSSPSGSTLDIVVLPFFWQTLSFKLLAASVSFIAAAGIIWRVLHNRRVRFEDRLVQQQVASEALLREQAQRLKSEREARTFSQRLLTVHETERSRVARELHDDVTQRLARLAIDAALTERGATPLVHNGKPRSMREELVRLSEDVHSLAYRLHPSILDELGLAEAIRAECSLFSRRGIFLAVLRPTDIPARIQRDAALCLFRIAQESLRNVEKHAKATTVDVSLTKTDGGIQLAVHDDGVGFVPSQKQQTPTLGHASMRERVDLLDGELAIESEPSHGSTILAWVPLHEEAKDP